MENETNVPSGLSLGFCIGILKNMNIQLLAKEIKMPTAANLTKIYKSFLQECLSIQYDAYEKDNLEDAILNFNEEVIKMQSDSFKQMQFYIIVKYFFELCGLTPSYMEIFHPMKNKFPKLLSGMVSFCRFEFQELGDDVTQCIQDNKVYMRHCGDERKEINELQGKIYYINSNILKNKPLVEQCKKRTLSLKEKNNEFLNEYKKQETIELAFDKQETTLDAEEKALIEKQLAIKKKFILYEKLIFQSPERLNNEMEKNEARIVELKKYEQTVQAEIDEELKKLHEREKFLVSSMGIKETLETNFLNQIENANSKKEAIEAIKETNTNLNLVYKQTESTIEALKKSKNDAINDVNGYIREFENNTQKFIETENQKSNEMNEKTMFLKECAEEKEILLIKIKETELQSHEMMENSLEKIQMFQKNEEFCKTLLSAKMKTLNSLKDSSTEKVEDISIRLKKSLEIFKKFDKEARGL